jgi:hypothetical protein
MIELFHVARTSIICAKRGRDFLFSSHSARIHERYGEKLSLRRDVMQTYSLCYAPLLRTIHLEMTFSQISSILLCGYVCVRWGAPSALPARVGVCAKSF